MKRRVLGLFAAASLPFAVLAVGAGDANAWFHAGPAGTASGGGGSWSAHGWRGGSASGGGGSWSAQGWRGGTASGGGGAWHGTTAGGTSVSGYHYGGNYYGGSYYGGYHPPTTVNYYGNGCYNCGGWGAGAAAAGLLTGAAIGAAAASAGNAAATSNAYAAGVAAGTAQANAIGTIYATLPTGCAYQPAGATAYYHCGGFWVEPAFGANGVYYRSVPAP